MKRYLTYMLLPFLLACGGDDEIAIPDLVLGEEKMVEVLLETQLVEGALLKKIIPGKRRADMEKQAMIEYGVIFEQHGVTKAEFDSSWTFYLAHPTLLEPIYDTVVARLERMQKSLPKPEGAPAAAPKNKKDPQKK